MSPPRWTGRWVAIGLLGAALVGAGVYRLTAKREEPRRELAEPIVSPAAAGKRVFVSHCAACHQLNGRGLPGVYPPLAGSEWVNGAEDRIIRIVLHGLVGPTQVKGETFNNVMIPFRGVLSDEQIAQVLTYIRQEWGNDSVAVLTTKVAAIRHLTETRAAAWTAAELMALP